MGDEEGYFSWILDENKAIIKDLQEQVNSLKKQLANKNDR